MMNGSKPCSPSGGPQDAEVQSGGGQDCVCPVPPPHEPLPQIREVLECASPLALSEAAEASFDRHPA